MELKIGNWLELRLRERTLEKPATGEVGASGTTIFSGQLYDEEYNPDLKGEAAIKVYERMRKSDGQVKAALLACKLPLMVARWDVVPASDSNEDMMIAETVKAALFDEMTITWDSFLRQSLLMFDFGFMPFEKVWELRDGLYKWKRLAPRLPSSIQRWFFTPGGELDYVEQVAYRDDTFATIDIPASKLVVFTHEMEGQNFRGVSLLRAAYKHYWYKNTLYAIDGIAAERHGVGLASFSYPNNATQEQKDAIKEVGQRLHTHERAYVALPDAIKFQLLGVQGQLHDIKGSIEHHDVMIVRSVLAQFLNVGSKEVGSYALSNDQSRFFLFALQSAGGNLKDTINRNVIREMVDYNWQVHGKYPKMTVSGLDNPEIAAYATAISSLSTSGMLTPDRGTEAELRRLLKFPQKEEQPVRISQPAPEEEPSPEGQSAGRQAAEGGRYWRQPVGVEKLVALDEIDDRLKTAEQEFIAAVKPIQDKQIASVVETVAGYIADEEYDRLTEIDIPFRSKVADAIDDLLKDLMKFGEEQVREEAAGQGKGMRAQDEDAEPVEKPDPDIFIRIRALAIANLLANKMRSAMSWEAMRQVRLGALDKTGMMTVLTGLSDRDLGMMAQVSTVEALNLGRLEQARRDADIIDRVMSSAILDANTCGFCKTRDGQEWSYGSEPAAPPYDECEGKDHCRCIHVYIYRGEA